VIGEMFSLSGFAPIARENHIIKPFPLCLRFRPENEKKISHSDISSRSNIIKFALVLSIKILINNILITWVILSVFLLEGK
jgi:hypothetical protein